MKIKRPAPEPLPKPPCQICAHPRVEAINEVLRGGVGLKPIAAQLKLHKPDLAQHKEFCLRGAPPRPPSMKAQIPTATGTTSDGRDLVAHAPGLALRVDIDLEAYTDLGDGKFMLKREIFLGTNRLGARVEVTVAPIKEPPAAMIPVAPKPMATARKTIWKGES